MAESRFADYNSLNGAADRTLIALSQPVTGQYESVNG
jgi:hypothetical protein